jgi:rhamnosyltransferase
MEIMTTVSIIILAKNEEENIDHCLEAVFSQKADFNFEVIVIDSGSTDDTLDIVRSTPARLFEIPPGDFDHGGTRQYGAERARGEYIVTLVADATPCDENWLANLLAPFKKDANIAGVYGRQIPRADADPFFAWRLAQWVTGNSEPREHFFPTPDEIEKLSPEEKRVGLNFDDINSARRADILREFPFPEAEYAEDLVWARDVLIAGKKLVYAPPAAVYHSHRRTPGYAFKKRFLDQRFNRAYYGLELYPALTIAMRALRQETKNYFGVARRLKGLGRKLRWSLLAPFFAAAEISGSFLGILSAKEESECPHRAERKLRRLALRIARKYKASPIRHP